MASTWTKLGKAVIPALMATTMLCASGNTANAGSSISIGIGIFAPSAPPPPRYERIPPRPYHADYIVWVPGHWEWRHGQWVWLGGYYAEGPGPDYYWEPGQWNHGDNGWHYAKGSWRHHGKSWRHNGRDD